MFQGLSYNKLCVFMMSFSGGGESRDRYKGVTGTESGRQIWLLGQSLTSENIKLIFNICSMV